MGLMITREISPVTNRDAPSSVTTYNNAPGEPFCMRPAAQGRGRLHLMLMESETLA